MRFIDRTIRIPLPTREKISRRKGFAPWAVALCVTVGLADTALAVPTVSQASGAFNHKAIVTITGSGFGSKATAAPLVWDDASGTNVLSKWSGYWPDIALNPNGTRNLSGDMQYMSAPVLGANPPHNRTGRYLTGLHGSCGNFHTGQDVAVWKDFTRVEGGFVYFSWYNYVNPNWGFTGGMMPEDGNFKIFGYSVQGSIYELPNNWYIAQWDGAGRGLYSATATNYETIINDDSGGSGLIGGVFQGAMINPLGGAWVKQEVLIKVSSSAGLLQMFENGFRNVNYTGRTDAYPNTGRSAGIGGFARSCENPNNRRYFADIYMDTSAQRVVLGNASTYATSTIREMQIPTSWADGSINVTVNLGKFSLGQTAYLYVFDATGTPNAAGIPVTVGADGLTRPTNLRVL